MTHTATTAAAPLADLLRSQRSRLGLTLRGLVANARAVCISAASRWERGALPHRNQLPSLAAAYVLPLEDVTDAWQAARDARRSAP